jgi:ArsR family transcriptional regulator, cadmium/lead-responsive transcriptional repressor
MPADPSGAVFSALADPTRRQLLSAIAAHPATATELAGELPISRQAVVKHLNLLARAGLLEREREGRDVRYRVTPEPLSDAVSWIAAVSGEWDARLATLRSSLSSLGGDHRPEGRPSS